MKTRIRQLDDTVVVSIEGKLSFDSHEPLKSHLAEVLAQSQNIADPKKVIFDFENLEFVGSSGISAFVLTLKQLNTLTQEKPRYCNVATEFQRIMKAFDETDIFEFYESEDKARRSFDH